jgi:hypothetical protein
VMPGMAVTGSCGPRAVGGQAASGVVDLCARETRQRRYEPRVDVQGQPLSRFVQAVVGLALRWAVKVRTGTGRRLTVRLIGIDTRETEKPG